MNVKEGEGMGYYKNNNNLANPIMMNIAGINLQEV